MAHVTNQREVSITEIEQRMYDSSHEAEDDSASNVAIEILSRSLQAIGESPVMKTGMQEIEIHEKRFRKYQFNIE